LCGGMCADDSVLELFEKQNPGRIWKTGNNGCFVEFDGTRTLVSILHQTNKTSPYRYAADSGRILKDGQTVRENVTAKIYPDWYNVKLSTGRAFSDVFVLEGESFFHLAYKGCDYMSKGVGCKFCATGRRNARESKPSEIGEAAGIIKNHIRNAQICLGGGTYLPIGDNVSFFIDCVKEIRKRDRDIPIWIEMVPPEKDDVLRLIDAGATAFGFNIEVWDDDARKEICPGKSEISKKHYLDMLSFTARMLPDKVGSVLIAGLDKPESVAAGIDALADIGVHPCILSFKRWDGAKLEKRGPAAAHEFIELSNRAVGQMRKAGLNLLKNQGCLLCECCTVMHDLWRKTL